MDTRDADEQPARSPFQKGTNNNAHTVDSKPRASCGPGRNSGDFATGRVRRVEVNGTDSPDWSVWAANARGAGGLPRPPTSTPSRREPRAPPPVSPSSLRELGCEPTACGAMTLRLNPFWNSESCVTNRTVGNGRALGPGPRSWSGRVPRLGKAQGPALSTALGSPSTTQVGSNRREILPRNNLPDIAIACDLGPFCCRGLNRDATGRIVGPSCANHRRRQSSPVAQLWRYSQW